MDRSMDAQIDEPAALEGLLAEGPLAGRRVRRVEIAESAGIALMVDLNPSDIADVPALERSWRACRDVAERAGRWPLLVGHANEETFSRFFYGPDGADRSPERILAEASSVDRGIAPVDDEPEEWRNQPWPGAAERLVWDELGTLAAASFLPNPSPSSATAYVHYWGAGESVREQAEFVASARRWEDEFGFEVVANESVLLTVLLRRPPRDADRALGLARELARYWRWDEPIAGLAEALLGRERPFSMFDRP